MQDTKHATHAAPTTSTTTSPTTSTTTSSTPTTPTTKTLADLDDDVLAAALRLVGRALDVDGGTVVSCAPAARASCDVVTARAGRASVVVSGDDVYFLRTRTNTSGAHRVGWFRLALPTQHLRRR